MKNKILFLFFVSILCVTRPVFAEYGPEGKHFGLGLYAGEPTGLTGKFYLAEQTSIQGIASWSFFDDAVTLIGDFLYDLKDLAENSREFSLPFYVGAGAKFVIENDNANNNSTFGMHFPIGIAWQSAEFPLEIAFELAPGIDLAPETEFDINGGVAFRFYF